MEQMNTGIEESKPNFKQVNNVAHAKKYNNYKKEKANKETKQRNSNIAALKLKGKKIEQTFQNKPKVISILPEVDLVYVCVQWLALTGECPSITLSFVLAYNQVLHFHHLKCFLPL